MNVSLGHPTAAGFSFIEVILWSIYFDVEGHCPASALGFYWAREGEQSP